MGPLLDNQRIHKLIMTQLSGLEFLLRHYNDTSKTI